MCRCRREESLREQVENTTMTVINAQEENEQRCCRCCRCCCCCCEDNDF